MASMGYGTQTSYKLRKLAGNIRAVAPANLHILEGFSSMLPNLKVMDDHPVSGLNDIFAEGLLFIFSATLRVPAARGYP